MQKILLLLTGALLMLNAKAETPSYYHPAMNYKRPAKVAVDRQKVKQEMVDRLPVFREPKTYQVSLLVGQSSASGMENANRASFGLGVSKFLKNGFQMSIEALLQTHDQIQKDLPVIQVKRNTLNPELKYVFVPKHWVSQPVIGAGLSYTAIELKYRKNQDLVDSQEIEQVHLDEFAGSLTLGMDFNLLDGFLLGFQWKGLMPITIKEHSPEPGLITYKSDLNYMVAAAARFQF